MKVDSAGQPVNEGTFGLYGGAFSARVSRTFIDPVKDDEYVQRTMTNGGYYVDSGDEGEQLATPEEFTATYDGVNVKAQDGAIVRVGDIVQNDGSLYRILHLYPIGTLKGIWCAEVEEPDGTPLGGAGPTGQYAMTWGSIEKVVERAPAGFKKKRAKKGDGIDLGSKVGPVYVGDTVRTDTQYPGIWTVMGTDGTKTKVVLLKPIDDAAKATKVKQDLATGEKYVRTDGCMRFGYSRVTERLTEHQQDEDGELGNIDNDDNIQLTEEGSDDSMAPTKQTSVGKVDVVREGSKITLPVGMPTRTAIKELTRQLEQDEMDVSIMEIIDGFPLDAAHAFVQALSIKYGWVNALPTPGFFGPQPPVMIGVVVDPDGRSVQIPWGQIGIPGVTGNLATGIQFKDGKPCFCIQGTVKQKDKGVVSEIALMTKDYLRDHSIYKGKAVRMKFPEKDAKAFSPLDHQPKFIQTTDVRPDELIFSKDVGRQIAVNIWTPIQSLPAVKAARVPLKRGVLLYGRYGVGKTLLASVTARMAVQNGVTFIDLVDSNQLPQAVEFGRMLGGMVCIFAEDIDRCDEGGNRTDAFNEILNTVDGLTSKTDEVMIVYTTNHIERISKAMLRQGRIDKVIHIKEPDADAAVRLVRLYARHTLPAGEDITAVGELLAGFIPAAIREVVEQSKLAAIERGDVHNITAEDLRITVEGTREHMDLLKEPVKDDRSDLEKAADAFGKRVASTLVNALDNDGFENVREVLEEKLGEPGKRKAA